MGVKAVCDSAANGSVNARESSGGDVSSVARVYDCYEAVAGNSAYGVNGFVWTDADGEYVSAYVDAIYSSVVCVTDEYAYSA